MLNAFKENLLSLPPRFLLRGQRIYLVCGMPRSGNHALINWLANATVGRPTSYEKIDSHRYLYRFGSGETLFLNNVKIRNNRRYLRTLWTRREAFSQARNLIFSVENAGPGYREWKVPRTNQKIYVKRSLLNMVASRLKGLRKKAAEGLSDPQLTVDERMFRILKEWEAAEGYHTWIYDRWLSSPEYRRKFLDDLGLEKDIMPEMGSVGGSSFDRDKTPESHEALNRYRQVDFPPRVVELLFRHEELLSGEEAAWLRDTYGNTGP